jgi:hypothetical protein
MDFWKWYFLENRPRTARCPSSCRSDSCFGWSRWFARDTFYETDTQWFFPHGQVPGEAETFDLPFLHLPLSVALR